MTELFLKPTTIIRVSSDRTEVQQLIEIEAHILYTCDGPLTRFGLIANAIDLARNSDLDTNFIASELEHILEEWDAGEYEDIGQRS